MPWGRINIASICIIVTFKSLFQCFIQFKISSHTERMSDVQMKITPEISALVEKNRYFWKPQTCNIFWIYSGVNKVSVVRTGGGGGSARKSLFFNIFTHIFA